jgi:hypothetical protein
VGRGAANYQLGREPRFGCRIVKSASNAPASRVRDVFLHRLRRTTGEVFDIMR